MNASQIEVATICRTGVVVVAVERGTLLEHAGDTSRSLSAWGSIHDGPAPGGVVTTLAGTARVGCTGVPVVARGLGSSHARAFLARRSHETGAPAGGPIGCWRGHTLSFRRIAHHEGAFAALDTSRSAGGSQGALSVLAFQGSFAPGSRHAPGAIPIGQAGTISLGTDALTGHADVSSGAGVSVVAR